MGHGHGHGASGRDDRRRLAAALGVTIATTVVGAVGAALTGSLALLADLGHLLTDGGALAAAYVASLLAARPRTARRTFGSGRAEVLTAALNAVALLAVVGWVLIEGVSRLVEPTEVAGVPMLVVGVLGLAGNVMALLILARGSRDNMNVRGAALHVAGDALGSVGVLTAAVVMLTTGWPYADTVASLLIVALLLPKAIGLLRESAHLLMEGVPPGVDVGEVERALLAVSGVVAVHDLHVWAINDRRPAMSAHLVVESDRLYGDGGSVLDQSGALLRDEFGLTHATIQVERKRLRPCESICA